MKKARSESRNTTINIITSIGVLCTNLVISFFLSPYIIRTIGVEANGFVTLANSFVNYANLIVTALNAMAARFITIEYIKGDYDRANLYYNSVFWGNLVIDALLLIPAAVLIIWLELFINVPIDILLDVKILFGIVFLAFFIRTGAPNYDCGTYIKNRMDLVYIPSMATALLRCVLLVCMFSIFPTRVWYVGFTSTLISVIALFIAGHYNHVLTPELRINRTKPLYSMKAIKELVGSGIWNSISIAGNTLLSGLDLLICNICLGPTLMGVLSLSKTLPSVLVTLSESIRGAFGPELTISFAKGDKDNILACIRKGMKITSVIITVPTAGLVVMSDAFYSLWVPSQDAKLLQVLTALSILSYLLNSGVVILFNVYTTVNKVKYNSLAMIISGVLSVAVTMLLITYTDYDLYAVAGVSSVVTICKNLFFTIPVASRLLSYKWYQFYPQVGLSVLCSGLIIVVGKIVRFFLPVDSWIMFFLACAVIAVIGFMVNAIIVLNREEKQFLLGIIRRKIFRKASD